MPTSDARTIGIEAYTYLYPLVLMDVTRRQLTNVDVGVRPGHGPMDAFTHVRAFPPADFREVVRPNFDTLYSIAWLDVREEPRIVTAADTGGRYYLLPMLDMWTDAFAVPGSRTSGTGAGAWAVTPPGWQGELPAGVERIEAPTRYVWVIGRTQTNGPADYDAVHAVQAGFTVTPLGRWGQGPYTPPADVDPTVSREEPMHQVAAMSAQEFFTYGAELMRLHPPHLTDWSILARMRRIGIVAGEPLDWDAVAADTRAALADVPGAALAALQGLMPHTAPIRNGWLMNTSAMGVYGTWYAKRALVALVGLGANPAEDAIYPVLEVDADGHPLDGANDYVLHFAPDELPPAGAFWSVTMYDAEGFQVANELDRFAIGDRDPLVYAEDGSLTLHIQHGRPSDDRVANWLPAPRGPLGVTMRLYAPLPPALDGSWAPPAVRKV